MFKILLKQFIIVALIIIAVASVIFGAALPWFKARSYIDTLTMLQSGRITSVDQFERYFGGVLDYYSPIGQEEVVKFLSSDISSMMLGEANETGKIGQVAPMLVDFISPYLFKNNVIHLIFGAEAYKTLWRFSGNENYFKKSEDYYFKLYAIGPKLPPVVYGIYDLYGLKGDKEKVKKFGSEILNYWPDDASVRKIVSSL